MKFYVLLVAALFSATNLIASSAEEKRAELTRFIRLSQRCQESLRAARTQRAIDSFSAINAAYKKHRIPLKNLVALDEKTLSMVHKECSHAVKTEVLAPRRNPGLVTAQDNTSEVNRAFISTDPDDTLSLGHAISFFGAQFEDDLLKKTTIARWAQRLGLQTIIETVALSTSCALDVRFNPDKKQELAVHDPNTPKPPPTEIQLIPLEKRFNLKSIEPGFLASNIGVAFARLGAHCAVDEFVPKGASKYWQRLSELVAPVLVAGALTYGLAKTDVLKIGGKMRSKLIGKSMMRALMRLAMTRFLLSKSSKLYAPVNAFALVLPFCMGNIAKVVGPNLKNGFRSNLTNWQTYLHILLDGGIATALYEGLPKVVDKLIPKRGGLNPAHRRKAIKNATRDMVVEFDKLLEATA